jgi:hypothetical protein
MHDRLLPLRSFRVLIRAASILGPILLAVGTPLTLCLLARFDMGILGGFGVVLYFAGVVLRLVSLSPRTLPDY